MLAEGPVVSLSAYLKSLGSCENQDFSLAKALRPFGIKTVDKTCEGFLMGYFIDSLTGLLGERYPVLQAHSCPVSLSDIIQAAAELDDECIEG